MPCSNRTVTGLAALAISSSAAARKIVEDARVTQRAIVRKEDVELVDTPRGFRTGCYIGIDGDRPSRLIDAYVHEVDPGVVSTMHRHSWDGVMLIVEGHGWTEVNGVRYEYKPWDSVYIPAWAWHRQGNDGAKTARFITFRDRTPQASVCGAAFIEDVPATPRLPTLPAPPISSPGTVGADP